MHMYMYMYMYMYIAHMHACIHFDQEGIMHTSLQTLTTSDTCLYQVLGLTFLAAQAQP